MSAEKPRITEELRILPWWAYLFAVLAIGAAGPYFYFHGIQLGRHAPAFMAFVSVVASCAIAFFVLLIGYVNRDAKRRNMKSALWTALVLFIPNAIGFIIYFLLRQPVMVKCPQCGAQAHSDFNYCPQCKYNLRPTCPKCAHGVQTSDAFCPHCSYELKGVAAA